MEKEGKINLSILIFFPTIYLIFFPTIYYQGVYVRRKVRIGTIPELSCAKWEFSLCPPIPELYRTILELRKGCRLYIDWVYSLRKVGIVGQSENGQSGNSWTKWEWDAVLRNIK